MLTDDYQFPDGVHVDRNQERCGPEPTAGNMQVLREEMDSLNSRLDGLTRRLDDMYVAYQNSLEVIRTVIASHIEDHETKDTQKLRGLERT